MQHTSTVYDRPVDGCCRGREWVAMSGKNNIKTYDACLLLIYMRTNTSDYNTLRLTLELTAWVPSVGVTSPYTVY